ncbi:FecR family protein [Caulobacter mirabilis]|uniref:FecR protein domain-containing protein n=1 Tax=Caulobacter mirabilis TaxID=69666 RepID=A0A2D2B2X0_9CAUL|nr:FecR domain-containing protein [Caulobacter mirabilis]ATQ44610.1 hypothetical protein CSW64_20545 [Caulobacter mirabilis]
MPIDAGHGDLDPDILEQAAAWRIRLSEQGLESSLELETWLAEDARHEQAWIAVERSWNRVAQAEAEAAPLERERARRRALRNARSEGARRRLGMARPAVAASVAILVIASTAGVWTWQARQTQTYTTVPGERRTVVLKDGSSMQLDSGTVLKVRYTARARTVELDQGQARFEVAHDAARPFSVRAGEQSVVATGTNFNVDMLPSRLLVTLLQGTVRVEPRPHGWRVSKTQRANWTPVNMTAGQELTILKNGAAPSLRQAKTDQVTAWNAGLLSFDEEPLSSVVERVNRYASVAVVVDDPATANLPVSGVFKAGDVPGLVDTVTEYLPVQASTGANGAIHLSRRDR